MKRCLQLFFLLAALLFIGTPTLLAQEKTFNKVKRFSIRNSGPVLQQNELKGYYYFYIKDREDAKNNAFTIQLLDDNLNDVIDFTVTKPKTSRLLEVVYNQSAFMFMFYEKGKFAFETYDLTGKKVGGKINPKPSMFERARVQQSLTNDEVENNSIFPIGSEGFVRVNWQKNKKQGYLVEGFDNKGKTIWEHGSDINSNLLELADILFCDGKYVVLNVGKRKSMFAKSFDTDLVILDAATGKVLVKRELKDKTSGELSLLNCFYDEKQDGFMVVGEYYNAGDEVLKDKSQGLYTQFIKIGDDKNKDIVKLGWAKEIAKVRKGATSEDDPKAKRSLYFHKFIIAENGHIFGIAEEYRITASAIGIASTVLGGNGSDKPATIQLTVTDMVVVEFDENRKIIGYNVVPKKKTRVLLRSGAEFSPAPALAAYVKMQGGFDYAFSSVDAENDTYTVLYTDYDREKEDGDKADKMLGVISIKGGEVTSTRVPIESEARLFAVGPAKPGYFVLTEYFRKQKKFVTHLERIEE
jgi:hypothetical protein